MQEQEEKLRQEIIGDARTKADRLIKRAKRDAEKRAARARERQDKARQVRVKEAELRAEGRVRAILAGIDHEILTHWLLRREAASTLAARFWGCSRTLRVRSGPAPWSSVCSPVTWRGCRRAA